MEARSCLAIVLAAGEGTRMRSARPRSCIRSPGGRCSRHVLAAVAEFGAASTADRRRPGAGRGCRRSQTRFCPSAACFVQQERRGTAHAVLAAKSAITRQPDDILVVYGDTPLIRPATLKRLRAPLAAGAAVAVLRFGRPIRRATAG